MTEKITEFSRDGWTFDVVDSGPIPGAASDIPVILLHGFPDRASCWGDVTPLLNERGLRTVAPDQRGYSPGARPQSVRDYRIGELVDDAVSRGATVLTGGTIPDREGFFYPATVLKDVPADSRVCHEEIFGPVAPIIVCDDVDEMLALWGII